MQTTSGAIATLAPLISTARGVMSGRSAARRVMQQAGRVTSEPIDKLQEEVRKAQAELDVLLAHGEHLPYGVSRMALYTRSSQNFADELRREQRIMHYFNTVATQNDIIGPAVGATTLGQGILGTYAHYKYAGNDEKTKAGLDYAGFITGTVGSAVAVGVTAG